MKTIGEVLTAAAGYLQKKSVLASRVSAEELLAFVLDCKRMDLYLRFDQPLQENEIEKFRECIKRRSLHEPVDYVIGKVEFLKSCIAVSPDVLIPRPETEILVEKVLKEVLDWENKKVLDLCTGSGCMAIAIKKQRPEARVFASDISKEALKKAEENALNNEVKISFTLSDLFSSLSKEKFDIILCNPPYISTYAFAHLSPDVVQYEPKLALEAGEGGLFFYRELAQTLPEHLERGAKVFFEIGYDQGSAVKELFSAPCWVSKRVECDWSGKDRFFFLEFE